MTERVIPTGDTEVIGQVANGQHLVDLVRSQRGVDGVHQCNDASDMRTGHRRAGEKHVTKLDQAQRIVGAGTEHENGNISARGDDIDRGPEVRITG